MYQASGSSEQAIFDPGVCFARVKDSDKAPAFLFGVGSHFSIEMLFLSPIFFPPPLRHFYFSSF